MTLRERREKQKLDKVEEKARRIAKKYEKDIDKSMKEITRIAQKDTTECVNGFILARMNDDEKGMERFASRFVQVDKKLHELLKSDDWSEEKSYETFDMLLENAMREIYGNLLIQNPEIAKDENNG